MDCVKHNACTTSFNAIRNVQWLSSGSLWMIWGKEILNNFKKLNEVGILTQIWLHLLWCTISHSMGKYWLIGTVNIFHSIYSLLLTSKSLWSLSTTQVHHLQFWAALHLLDKYLRKQLTQTCSYCECPFKKQYEKTQFIVIGMLFLQDCCIPYSAINSIWLWTSYSAAQFLSSLVNWQSQRKRGLVKWFLRSSI